MFRTKLLPATLHFCIFLLLAVTGCATGPNSRLSEDQPTSPATPTWVSGSHTITVDGRHRTFLLDVPKNLKPGAALVLVFHGYTGSAVKIHASSGFTPLTEEHGFVAAYPQGTMDARGNTFFNVGYEFHKESKVDDVKFANELTSRLVKDLALDPDAVFSTGMSNGGDMSYFLASQPDPFVRSIAPVAGTMMVSGNEAFVPKKRLSVMEVHGTDDTITRWNGDLENRDSWGAYYGTDAVMRFWIDGFALKKSEITRIENIPSERKQIQLHRWWTATDDTEVLLYEILKGKHSWPVNLGRQEVSTAAEIWSFFDRHRSPRKGGLSNGQKTSNQ